MSQGEPQSMRRNCVPLEKQKKAKVRSFQTFKGRQVMGRDYDHQTFCQSCLVGGDIIFCDSVLLRIIFVLGTHGEGYESVHVRMELSASFL